MIAQGTEAGGHTGSISTMVLLAQVVQICKGRADVLSAGGYAHGSQVLAALAMGAQGVWAGPSGWGRRKVRFSQINENCCRSVESRHGADQINHRKASACAHRQVYGNLVTA